MRPLTGSRRKLATLKASRILMRGGLIGHPTGTVAGIAAHPHRASAVTGLKRFKQRRGPFLLLADSAQRALHQVPYLTPTMRRLVRESWPGPVTLILKGRKQLLPSCCYQKGHVAVRVDADPETRRLARLCGGLLLSSSLNRRRGRPHAPNARLHMRWHRFLSGRIATDQAGGKASKIIRLNHRRIEAIRA